MQEMANHFSNAEGPVHTCGMSTVLQLQCLVLVTQGQLALRSVLEKWQSRQAHGDVARYLCRRGSMGCGVSSLTLMVVKVAREGGQSVFTQSPQSFLTLHWPKRSRLTTSLVSSFSLNEDNKSICFRALGKLTRFHGLPRTVPPQIVAFSLIVSLNQFPSILEFAVVSQVMKVPPALTGCTLPATSEPMGRSLTHSLPACSKHCVSGDKRHCPLSRTAQWSQSQHAGPGDWRQA